MFNTNSLKPFYSHTPNLEMQQHDKEIILKILKILKVSKPAPQTAIPVASARFDSK